MVLAMRTHYRHLEEMRQALLDFMDSEMSHISDMLGHPRPSVTTLRFAGMVLIAPVGASHASGMASNHTPDFSIKNGSTLHKIDSFNYTRYIDLFIHYQSAKQAGLMKK